MSDIDPVRHETVGVRRSPKYGVFLVLGAGVGIVAAMILTFAFGSSDEVGSAGVAYTDGQVFGFLALVCVAVGMLLSGSLALVLDRVVGRRVRELNADHVHVRETD